MSAAMVLRLGKWYWSLRKDSGGRQPPIPISFPYLQPTVPVTNSKWLKLQPRWLLSEEPPTPLDNKRVFSPRKSRWWELYTRNYCRKHTLWHTSLPRSSKQLTPHRGVAPHSRVGARRSTGRGRCCSENKVPLLYVLVKNICPGPEKYIVLILLY